MEVDDAGSYRSVTLEQTAVPSHPTIRSHRMRVGAYDKTDGGLTRRPVVELDVVGALTAVDDLVGTPAADVLVTNDDDLAYAKVRLDPGSFAALQTSLSDLPALTRSVVWTAASDMVREAELSASAFVDLVVTHVAAEPDLATVQRLIAQVSTAIDVYGAPGKRLVARARVAALARDRLSRSEAASEEQLVWARLWMAMADEDADLDRMWRVLDGREVIDGLAIDVDMRWLIVGSLATHGAVGPEVVEAEFERDPTDIGRRRADSILAGRPDAAAKAAAWKRATTDTTAPLAVRRTVAAGIWQMGQEELLRPFVAAYADELPSWLAGFDSDVAISLTRNLLPMVLREEATATMLRSLLAGGSLDASARRVVAEGVDGIERALRAQAVDA
jgi:aminopeptidase N